ncbi:hypothetical protein Tco_0783320 [Tanacetum coccineum]
MSHGSTDPPLPGSVFGYGGSVDNATHENNVSNQNNDVLGKEVPVNKHVPTEYLKEDVEVSGCSKHFKSVEMPRSERGDGVTIYTRRRHHDTCDGVRILLTASNAQVIFDEKKLGSSRNFHLTISKDEI